MPGQYDNLSVPLSFMAQIFSFSSLILVPIGLLWLIIERLSNNQEVTDRRFTNLTFVIGGLLILIVSFAAFSQYEQSNTSLAILFFSISSFALTRTFVNFKKGTLKFNFLPMYLITIPIILAFARYEFFGKAVEFGRNTAIKNSETLIQSIENYKKSNGHYPISLQALHYDITPKVVGVPQYFYEPNGDAYNLYFRQLTDELDMEEIVMFNKLDEHYFTAHSQDILEYTGDTLVLRRGDRRRVNLSTPNWIYIKFD
jgi:hypothetical protein